MDLATDLVGHGVSLVGLVVFLNWRMGRLEKSLDEYENKLEKLLTSDGKLRERVARLEVALDFTPSHGRRIET